MPDDTVPAHDQSETIRLLRHYPEHGPRSGDPHYHLFEQTKSRLKQQGLWKCVIDTADCDGPISLHHSHFEFAYINDIAIPQAQALFGLHLTDEEFAQWIEGPGNLEPLCFKHHMGSLAIHLIPTADWDIVRAHKPGTTPIERQPK